MRVDLSVDLIKFNFLPCCCRHIVAYWIVTWSVSLCLTPLHLLSFHRAAAAAAKSSLHICGCILHWFKCSCHICTLTDWWVFVSFRVGVDPDQDLQPCGDSFQVLQGVSLNVFVLLPMKFLPSLYFKYWTFAMHMSEALKEEERRHVLAFDFHWRKN